MPGMIEYMCSYCGRKERKTVNSVKPQPGTCTKKGKTRDGRTRPHTWVKIEHIKIFLILSIYSWIKNLILQNIKTKCKQTTDNIEEQLYIWIDNLKNICCSSYTKNCSKYVECKNERK